MKEERDMSAHTPATAQGETATDELSSSRGRRPRIFSQTVGVHPIVALFALFAGAELFGLLGGFLAVPVAGALQHIIVALWHRWKDEHPDQFPPEEEPLQPSASLPGQQIAPTETPATSRRP